MKSLAKENLTVKQLAEYIEFDLDKEKPKIFACNHTSLYCRSCVFMVNEWIKDNFDDIPDYVLVYDE